MSARNVVVLGASGSVGKQCLEVMKSLGDFTVVGLAGGSAWQDVFELVMAWRPPLVAMADPKAARNLEEALRDHGLVDVRVLAGRDGVCEMAALKEADLVVHAVPGFEGIYSLLAALEGGKTVALAGKEALVSAGELVSRALFRYGGCLIPLDSEHNAVFQCLAGERKEDVVRIILTASGGPFRDLSKEEMARVGPADALKHPTWKMGPKITVDSATLFNKALEVIEAHCLFGLDYDRISVLVHREALVHALVEFRDGSTKALVANPDMKIPIAYALRYPARGPYGAEPLKLAGRTLSFEEPDLQRFPCLELGFRAGRMGGTAPCFLSAADEEVVRMFLEGCLPYLGIYPVLDGVLRGYEPLPVSNLEVLEKEARHARLKVREIASRVRAD